MKMLRDGVRFALIGALQLALDSTIYVVFTKAGMTPAPANLCGRVAGAALGFWLNGRVTFAHQAQPEARPRLARYAVLWLSLSAVSTLTLSVIAKQAGLARSWWAKPLVEAVLGVTSFVVARHWVYRRNTAPSC